jgi:hypothetical protein
MNNLAATIPIVLAISGILVWLLRPRENSAGNANATARSTINDGLPAPKHFRYFRQIRQALSSSDAEYLQQNAPKYVAQQALRERRGVAMGFLKGLHEDFSNLSRLGRIIASLSPEISHQQEAERLKLTAEFQILYAIVWLRLYTGNLPIEQLERLTGLVGRLSARMDEAMAEISTQAAGQFPEKLGT